MLLLLNLLNFSDQLLSSKLVYLSYFSTEQKEKLNDPTPGYGQVAPKGELKSKT